MQTEENINQKCATVYKPCKCFVSNNQSERRHAATHRKYPQDISFLLFHYCSSKLQYNPWCNANAPLLALFNFGYSEIKICFQCEFDMKSCQSISDNIEYIVLYAFLACQGLLHVHIFCWHWTKTDSVLSHDAQWMYPKSFFPCSSQRESLRISLQVSIDNK